MKERKFLITKADNEIYIVDCTMKSYFLKQLELRSFLFNPSRKDALSSESFKRVIYKHDADAYVFVCVYSNAYSLKLLVGLFMDHFSLHLVVLFVYGFCRFSNM
jgi:hypothetical protein